MSIDTFCIDQIICPFCGAVVDPTDYDGDEHTGACDECCKEFDIEFDYSVAYTTSKPDWLRRWRTYNEHQVSKKKKYAWIAEHGDD